MTSRLASYDSDAATNGPKQCRLRYGVNEALGWHEFALGKNRELIRHRLRAIDTQIIRIYAFDRYTPDPIRNWALFARYVQAVLDAGAIPMITLTRFRPPFNDASTLRWFAQRCGDLVWNCIEHWGGDAVRDWYWCIWNEPNSAWNNPDLTFERYRRIYKEVTHEILRWLGRYLGGRRALIGGPAVDTFQPFWLDWLWQFVHEIDNSLIGFVLWHRFGDWRALGEWGAPAEDRIHRRLLMARTSEYFDLAETVQRLTRQRGILNICGRLNVNSHHEPRVSAGVNQSMFGAVFYALSLVELMRGGADGELYWMGTDPAGPHALWDDHGNPTPAFTAKQLIVLAVRPDDEITFSDAAPGSPSLTVLRTSKGGRARSALFVHASEHPQSYCLADVLGTNHHAYAVLRQIDASTEHRIIKSNCNANITFHGFGVAVALTDDACSELRQGATQ